MAQASHNGLLFCGQIRRYLFLFIFYLSKWRRRAQRPSALWTVQERFLRLSPVPLKIRYFSTKVRHVSTSTAGATNLLLSPSQPAPPPPRERDPPPRRHRLSAPLPAPLVRLCARQEEEEARQEEEEGAHPTKWFLYYDQCSTEYPCRRI